MASKLALLLALTCAITYQVYALQDQPGNVEPTLTLRGMFSGLGGGGSSNYNRPSSPIRQRSGKRRDDPNKLRKQVVNHQAQQAQLEAQRRQQQIAAPQAQQQKRRMSPGGKPKKSNEQGQNFWGQHLSPEQKRTLEEEYFRRINYL